MANLSRLSRLLRLGSRTCLPLALTTAVACSSGAAAPSGTGGTGSSASTGGGSGTATGGSTTTGGATGTSTGGNSTRASGGANSAGGKGSGGVSGTGGVSTTGGSGSIGTGGAGATAGTGAGSAGRGGAAGGVTGNGGTAGGTLPSTSLAVRFANAVLSRWPDPSTVAGTLASWDYNHGIVLRGIEQVYVHTGDARYLAYIQKYADQYVGATGTLTIAAAHNFDAIQPSVLLPFLFQKTGLAKYHTAADSVRARYDSIPKNADGGFWHKQTYPNQMWLDSIYMGMPFLARYGAVFGTCTPYCADTVSKQVLLIAEHTRDTTTGLLYHAWDDSAAVMKAAWADPTTGRSPVVWGRALGWYAMSLVDLLGDLPATASSRAQMLSILTSLADALKTTQDPTTGLWHQVVDKGSQADDWLETSGSGMFVYALKVGVARGYLDASYLAVANKGWQGLQTKVTNDANGLPTIGGAVQGMGVQVDYASYLNQMQLSNSPHGLCAILLAAAEMESL